MRGKTPRSTTINQMSEMASNKSYLLLGEGDFTYSLDMCRYIASLPSNITTITTAAGSESIEETSQCESHHHPHHTSSFSITCTGVDTLEELRAKYKDIDFILRKIRCCSSTMTCQEHHDVNGASKSVPKQSKNDGASMSSGNGNNIGQINSECYYIAWHQCSRGRRTQYTKQ